MADAGLPDRAQKLLELAQLHVEITLDCWEDTCPFGIVLEENPRTPPEATKPSSK